MSKKETKVIETDTGSFYILWHGMRTSNLHATRRAAEEELRALRRTEGRRIAASLRARQIVVDGQDVWVH